MVSLSVWHERGRERRVDVLLDVGDEVVRQLEPVDAVGHDRDFEVADLVAIPAGGCLPAGGAAALRGRMPESGAAAAAAPMTLLVRAYLLPEDVQPSGLLRPRHGLDGITPHPDNSPHRRRCSVRRKGRPPVGRPSSLFNRAVRSSGSTAPARTDSRCRPSRYSRRREREVEALHHHLVGRQPVVQLAAGLHRHRPVHVEGRLPIRIAHEQQGRACRDVGLHHHLRRSPTISHATCGPAYGPASRPR